MVVIGYGVLCSGCSCLGWFELSFVLFSFEMWDRVGCLGPLWVVGVFSVVVVQGSLVGCVLVVLCGYNILYEMLHCCLIGY